MDQIKYENKMKLNAFKLQSKSCMKDTIAGNHFLLTFFWMEKSVTRLKWTATADGVFFIIHM
jgi:hypothetical protein